MNLTLLWQNVPRQLKRVVEFFVENNKSGTIQLNFKDGRMLNVDYKIHDDIPEGWPQKNNGRT